MAQRLNGGITDRWTWGHACAAFSAVVPCSTLVALTVLSRTSVSTLARVSAIGWLCLLIIDEVGAMARPPRFKHGLSVGSLELGSAPTIPLRAVVPALFIFVAVMTRMAGSVSPATPEFFALVGICGFTAGMFAAPAAHELMHRRNWFDRHAATAVMFILCYPHFCIEHRYGHHKNVGTRSDGATARLGENLYGYLVRAVPAGVANAWTFEGKRLSRSGRRPLSHRNRIVKWIILLILLELAVCLLMGWAGALFFTCQSAVAVFTLETINYVQHYGLIRDVEGTETPEQVGPHHSWDSTHPITNFALLNLARHSDHHLHPAKHFAALEPLHRAPILPLGYFAVFWLALFPPAWHKVMDSKALATRQRHAPSLEPV